MNAYRIFKLLLEIVSVVLPIIENHKSTSDILSDNKTTSQS